QIIGTWNNLQKPQDIDIDDWVVRQYRLMYDAFFEDRNLIPAGNYSEVAYEELERDPIGEVRKIYQTLSLPDFTAFEPALQKYVSSLSGYQKNIFSELDPNLEARLRREWRRCFDEWGYA